MFGTTTIDRFWKFQRRKPELCTLEVQSQTMDQTLGVSLLQMDCKTRRRAFDSVLPSINCLLLLSVLYKTCHDTRGPSIP